MKNYKWQIFGLSFFLGIFLTIFYFTSNEKSEMTMEDMKEKEIIETVEILDNLVDNEAIEETIEQRAYRIGYNRGQRAMLIQMNKAQFIDEEAEYTVNFEIPPEEKEKLDEIMSNAYVEGYHKAGYLFCCPAGYTK